MNQTINVNKPIDNNLFNEIRILSLFDGISCGRVALERAGIPVNKYVAYEIEENAIKVSEYNYPDIIHKGDVFDAVYAEGEYDLLIGGSPCTTFSIARQKDKREKSINGVGWNLFMQYVRALKEVKPKWFLFENNDSMDNEIKNAITKELGVEPVLIDSADFSAQHRKRLYWTNIPIKPWTPSNILFEDIMLDDGTTSTRSIAQYEDTFKWSKDGLLVKWDTSGKGYYSQPNRARLPNQKWNTVCATRPDDKGRIWLGNNVTRSLSCSELEQLQTLPIGYTSCLSSKEARGKCIGNGWTVDVIAHILKGIKEN